jgi:hypothetical protein
MLRRATALRIAETTNFVQIAAYTAPSVIDRRRA